jgi:hypothetical protein
MAIAFPGTLVNHTGNVTQHKVTFVIEKENAQALSEIAIDGIGKQFLVIAYEIGKDVNLIEELTKDKEAGRKMLMKQLHAVIGKVALESGVVDDVVKHALRAKLIQTGIIKKSISELDEEGLSHALFLMQTVLSNNNFDYVKHSKEISI